MCGAVMTAENTILGQTIAHRVEFGSDDSDEDEDYMRKLPSSSNPGNIGGFSLPAGTGVMDMS